MDFSVVVLAAGLGKRMGQDTPKVLTKTTSGTLISLVLKTLEQITPKEVIIVVGHKKEEVISHVEDLKLTYPVKFVTQVEQKGTGDAAKSALPLLDDTSKTLILYGDTPLTKAQTLKDLIEYSKDSTLSVISEVVDDGKSLGRILRNNSNEFQKIVEAKDCTIEESEILEVNTGINFAKNSFLKSALNQLSPKNAQGEYYLTDIAEAAVRSKEKIKILKKSKTSEFLGVNTIQDLERVDSELNNRRIEKFQLQGVRFLHPESVLLGDDVLIEKGVVIGPSVQIYGETEILQGTKVEGTAVIVNSKIGKNCEIKLGVRIEGARIKNFCSVGPFAHIRPLTLMEDGVKIGNFVETKAAKLSEGVKASHLSYLGDCEIGDESNIGAGTITCNYDGFVKSKTVLGKNVFIGSNSSLVAPVKIEDGAIVGAGSVITENVAKDALALGRSKQVEKKEWAKTFREGKSSQKKK